MIIPYKYQSNYYLREKSKKECKEKTIQNKTNGPHSSLKETIKVEYKFKRNSWVETLHSLNYSEKEIAQDLQVNMS